MADAQDTTLVERLDRLEQILGLQKLPADTREAAGGNSTQSNHCASNFSVNCALPEVQAVR